MKIMERNKQSFYYCLYTGKTAVVDAEGNETGESSLAYSTEVLMKANVSAATGYAQIEQFGSNEQYDKVIVTDDMTCPIDENTVLFIDKEPVWDGSVPLYDYVVKRVARSLNSISYAVSKVKVS
jgi:hypothetical protein